MKRYTLSLKFFGLDEIGIRPEKKDLVLIPIIIVSLIMLCFTRSFENFANEQSMMAYYMDHMTAGLWDLAGDFYLPFWITVIIISIITSIWDTSPPTS